MCVGGGGGGGGGTCTLDIFHELHVQMLKMAPIIIWHCQNFQKFVDPERDPDLPTN